jgi:hypothetical protein
MIPSRHHRGTIWLQAVALVATLPIAARAETTPQNGLPDPLRGTPQIAPSVTGPDAEAIMSRLLPPRSDTPADWYAPVEPLHACGEPRALPPCVPPPPCHPSQAPRPYDLIGVAGAPSCGPIYRGPCAPRTGSHPDHHPGWLHGLHDRLFDRFYAPR